LTEIATSTDFFVGIPAEHKQKKNIPVLQPMQVILLLVQVAVENGIFSHGDLVETEIIL
jgi:hypothetical protein